MSDPESSKPRPARLPESEAAGASVKPTPARELAGSESREGPSGPRSGAHGPPEFPAEPDVDEVALEVGGVSRRVRVLGRSGAGDRSPPLLLLGFFEVGEERSGHSTEATVVARTLSEVALSRLEAALAASTPPPQSDRPKPFFEGAGQGRRGGSHRRDS